MTVLAQYVANYDEPLLVVPALDEEPWPTLGPQVCDFIESYLVHGPGDLRGQQMRLDDEKRALIYRAYEIYPQDHPTLAGRRRFKRVGISLRKGSAKTEWAAIICEVELDPDGPVRCHGWDGRGEPIGGPVTDPYIPMVAYTEEQSEELAYGALLAIVRDSQRARYFDAGEERIRRLSGEGKAVALASAPDGRDGARTTFQHFDEPLSLDTVVPTTAGWKTIGTIVAGDFVFGRDGRAVKVLGGSPVHEGRRCLRITFDNGESVVSDESHRWKAIEWTNRPGGERVVTTGQMYTAGVKTAHGYRWRLPRAAGLDGQRAALPIEPYLLGLWIGDGSTDAGYIHSSAADHPELAAGIEHAIADDGGSPLVRWLPKGLRSALRRAGILGRKHIPEAYLFSSREQRIALLQGLMDSDGHTTPGGSCAFVQKHRSLCEQVAVLVRSLGCNGTVTTQPDARSRTGQMCKVHFSPAFCPFRLQRKANAARWSVRRSTSWPAVVSIEPVDSVPVRCIAVDNDDHLFLIGRGLHLTHNTHRFNTPKLRAAHRTMLANIPKRMLSDAWSLETTTAPAPGEDSIAERTMDYARSIHEGRRAAADLFFFHRQASMHHDISTPKGIADAVLEASGPALAAWSDLRSIEGQFNDPTADIPYLRRVWLNQLVRATSRAFDVRIWARRAREGYTVEPRAWIALGFDGAQREDSTALIATEIPTGYQFPLGIWEKPTGISAEEEGAWSVPEEEVNAAVELAFKTFNVWRMYCDPYYWETWVSMWAGKYGDERVVRWPTVRFRKMADAVRAFDNAMKDAAETEQPQPERPEGDRSEQLAQLMEATEAIQNGERPPTPVAVPSRRDLSHSGDPVLTRHIANSFKMLTTYRDERGERMYVIQKERPGSPNKIDAAVGAVLSWQARLDALAKGIGRVVKQSYSVKWVG